jgi:protein TonB
MRILTVAFLAAAIGTQSAPAPRAGKVVEAGDGDVIVVRDRASIRVVSRMDANVRAIYNQADRWVILLLDQDLPGRGPDGRVDVAFTFSEVTGTWPLGDRWEGRATLDEYSMLNGPVSAGVGVNAGTGLIQLLSGAPGIRDARQRFEDAAAAATLTFAGSGRSGMVNQPFDQAEQTQLAAITRNSVGTPPGSPFRTGIDLRVGTSPEAPVPYPPPQAPVRVGGNIRTPAKIQDAEPVLPEAARQAGIRGVVILEIVIAPDGHVSSAKVLRSIPTLDEAAIEAVRKWRYEATPLNGMSVPVIMTVTVNFR